MKRKVYIGILAVALLLATVTGIVEHYRLNKDNLIQYFSDDTVFYLHARLHTDQIISNAFIKFLEQHPNFDTNFYPELEQYLQNWPTFDPSLVQEVSLGIVENNGEFVPVLAVVTRDEAAVNDLKNNLKDQDHIVKQDDLKLVVTTDDSVLDLDKDKTLSKKFSEKRRPLSNAWYGYVDLYRAQPWLEKQPGFNKISEIFAEISLKQSDIFASLSFRDDMLIITEDIRKLTNNDRIYADWKLRLASNSGFIANNIVFSSDLLQPVVTSLEIQDPNSKIRPGILERFRLENRELGEVLLSFGVNPEVSAVNMDQDMIIELTKSDSFDQTKFLAFISQLASYDYPSEQPTQLADGTYITELIAEDIGQISLNKEQKPFGELIEVISGDVKWHYSVLETGDKLYLANNADVFARAFSNNEVLFDLDMNECFLGNSSYLANFSVVDGFVRAYVWNLEPSAITFCLR